MRLGKTLTRVSFILVRVPIFTKNFVSPYLTVFICSIFLFNADDKSSDSEVLNEKNLLIFPNEKMKPMFLLMIWNFPQLEALNEHVKLEVCQIEMTNNSPDFLKLRYQERLQNFFRRNFQNIQPFVTE